MGNKIPVKNFVYVYRDFLGKVSALALSDCSAFEAVSASQCFNAHRELEKSMRYAITASISDALRGDSKFSEYAPQDLLANVSGNSYIPRKK